MTPSELVDKWDKLGFLESCENKYQMSRIYEDLCKILTNDDIILENRTFVEGSIFSLVSRLYNQRKLNFDTIELRILIKRYDKDVIGLKDLYGTFFNAIDAEVEFVAIYSETYKK